MTLNLGAYLWDTGREVLSKGQNLIKEAQPHIEYATTKVNNFASDFINDVKDRIHEFNQRAQKTEQELAEEAIKRQNEKEAEKRKQIIEKVDLDRRALEASGMPLTEIAAQFRIEASSLQRQGKYDIAEFYSNEARSLDNPAITQFHAKSNENKPKIDVNKGQQEMSRSLRIDADALAMSEIYAEAADLYEKAALLDNEGWKSALIAYQKAGNSAKAYECYERLKSQ